MSVKSLLCVNLKTVITEDLNSTASGVETVKFLVASLQWEFWAGNSFQ